jgi:hypothetical protein
LPSASGPPFGHLLTEDLTNRTPRRSEDVAAEQRRMLRSLIDDALDDWLEAKLIETSASQTLMVLQAVGLEESGSATIKQPVIRWR